MAVAVVVPNWNGAGLLDDCLGAIAAQTRPPDETIVVDNGSHDGSLRLLAERHPHVRVIALERNTGFAHAANRGVAATTAEQVALVNTDVVLARDWLARMGAALDDDATIASVACRMTQGAVLYSAGDVLRRDGVCEQRGRGEPADRYATSGEVFGACAGAALYRHDALEQVGGFDERFFAYIEDVDLALRLRLAGWRCAYEPVRAEHAAHGSSWQLERPVDAWVQRNTLLLMIKAFPLRWLPYVVYRQLGWAWHAALERRLRAHLRASLAALPATAATLRERRRLDRRAIARVVPHSRIRR